MLPPTTTPPAKVQMDASKQFSRIEYIDCLRGLAIFLVVYWHVGLNFLDGHKSISNQLLFLHFQMPIFFFISGFLSYFDYTVGNPDITRLRDKLYRRCREQLFPSVVMIILFSLLTGSHIINILFSEMKYGYWFTIVMVEIYVFYVLVTYICHKQKISRVISLLIFITIAIFSYIPIAVTHYIGKPEWWGLLSLDGFCRYLPFFMLGIVFKQYYTVLNGLIRRGIIMSIMIVLFFLPCLFREFTNPIISIMQGVLSVLIIFRLFQYYGKTFSKSNSFGRILEFVGRNTLEIYLLHQFVFYALGSIKPLINVQLIISSWIVELIFSSLISIAILAVCLLISQILKISPQLRFCLMGPSR